jgi:hypothetical protein
MSEKTGKANEITEIQAPIAQTFDPEVVPIQDKMKLERFKKEVESVCRN